MSNRFPTGASVMAVAGKTGSYNGRGYQRGGLLSGGASCWRS